MASYIPNIIGNRSITLLCSGLKRKSVGRNAHAFLKLYSGSDEFLNENKPEGEPQNC
jgi:hypothetical protein